ncbi:hypothetical protein, partial [Glutamicibacter sp. MNS18]|uniref:hypothetical protein n=1 Tax=Glutamicibacter sp. MNS18 TaxID=2989817 RepID=UPI00223566A7
KAIGNPSENKGETNEVPANNNQTLGTTHGGASSQAKCYVFTKYKTFGINKLGTLLSSQTTNTSDTTHHHQGGRFASEQLSNPTTP